MVQPYYFVGATDNFVQLCDRKKSLKKMFVDNSDITKRDAGYVWESNLVISRKFTFERVECKSFWFGFFILSGGSVSRPRPPATPPTNLITYQFFLCHELPFTGVTKNSIWYACGLLIPTSRTCIIMYYSKVSVVITSPYSKIRIHIRGPTLQVRARYLILCLTATASTCVSFK